MNRINKNLSALLICLLISVSAFNQIIFKTDNFSKTLTNVKDMNYAETDDFEFTFKINSDIKKYDKIEVKIYVKNEEDEDFKEYKYSDYFYWLPTSKAFIDQYADKDEIPCYIIKPESGPENQRVLANFKNSKDRFHLLKFKVIIAGYFEDGYESYWDNFSETYKTRTKYQFSKIFEESEEFSFAKDDKAVSERKEKERLQKIEEKNREYKNKSAEHYAIIKNAYNINFPIPILTVFIRSHGETILYWYEKCREDLIEKKDWDKLMAMEENLIAVKESSKKELRKAITAVKTLDERVTVMINYKPS